MNADPHPSPNAPRPGRRRFITAALALLAGGTVAARLTSSRSSAQAAELRSALAADVEIEEFSPAGKSLGVSRIGKVVRTEAEWRAELSAIAYRVTRQSGTELAFSGEYAESHANGLYRCICCSTALFDSRVKYDSGTGWPSFWQPISPTTCARAGMSAWGRRAMNSCQRGHGISCHVFDDGPRPTGLRYCINGWPCTSCRARRRRIRGSS